MDPAMCHLDISLSKVEPLCLLYLNKAEVTSKNMTTLLLCGKNYENYTKESIPGQSNMVGYISSRHSHVILQNCPSISSQEGVHQAESGSNTIHKSSVKSNLHSKNNNNKTTWIDKASNILPHFLIHSYWLCTWRCFPVYFDGITSACGAKKSFRLIGTVTLYVCILYILNMMLSDFPVIKVREDLSSIIVTHLGNLHSSFYKSQ